MTDLLDNIKRLIKRLFNVDVETFLAAIKLSPNAQGYLSGAISELLLKQSLEHNGYEILRIREKWEGRKHPNHHGDFYIKKKSSDNWYVLESKGVKSNSEKWHKFYNYPSLRNFLIDHKDKISWLDKDKSDEEKITQIDTWLVNNLPKFNDEYKGNLYSYDEVKKYYASGSKRDTSKSKDIKTLRESTNEDIEDSINERLAYIMEHVKVLETHFVSGKSEVGERTQATPRRDEFNLIAIDLFLRTGYHNFVFANPKQLEPSSSDSNHLQQNYIIGFIFPKEEPTKRMFIDTVWYTDFEKAFQSLSPSDAIKESDMQIDYRAEKIQEETEKELKTSGF